MENETTEPTLAAPGGRVAKALLTACLLLLLVDQLVSPSAPARESSSVPYEGLQAVAWAGKPVTPDLRVMPRGELLPVRADGAWRVLVVGDSAAYGFGLMRFQAFAARLQRSLEARGVPAEVVNAGVPGTNTRQQVGILGHALEEVHPDLVLLYSGNNEFVHYRVFRAMVPAWRASLAPWNPLEHLALYRWLKPRTLARLGRRRIPAGMVGKAVEALDVRVGPEDRAFVLRLYRDNLRRMIQDSRAAGADVMLCTVAANESSPPAGRFGVDRHERRGPPAPSLPHGQARQRESVLSTELQLHPGDADLHYERGRLRAELGDAEGARRDLAAAMELDPKPIRALPSFNEEVLRLGSELGVPVLDVVGELRGRTAEGILQDSQFLDFCHLAPAAHQDVAEAAAERILQERLVRPRAVRVPPPQPDLLDLEQCEWTTLPTPQGTDTHGLPPEHTVEGEALRGHLEMTRGGTHMAAWRYGRALERDPERRAVHWRNLGHALLAAGRTEGALQAYSSFLLAGGRDPALERLVRLAQPAAEAP